MHRSFFRLPLSDGRIGSLLFSGFQSTPILIRYCMIKGGRGLSNYNQDYLTGFLFVGLDNSILNEIAKEGDSISF